MMPKYRSCWNTHTCTHTHTRIHTRTHITPNIITCSCCITTGPSGLTSTRVSHWIKWGNILEKRLVFTSPGLVSVIGYMCNRTCIKVCVRVCNRGCAVSYVTLLHCTSDLKSVTVYVVFFFYRILHWMVDVCFLCRLCNHVVWIFYYSWTPQSFGVSNNSVSCTFIVQYVYGIHFKTLWPVYL